jgi:hypothetical protein
MNVCSTQGMLYSGITHDHGYGEIVRDVLTSRSLVMVKSRTTKREKKGLGGNHHEELEHKRIGRESQFTMPNTARTSPDLSGNYTDTRSFQPNQTCRTPDFSYPLVITLFPSLSPISLFLIYNSTTIADHKVEFFFFFSACHDHELTPSPRFIKSKQILSPAYTQD